MPGKPELSDLGADAAPGRAGGFDLPDGAPIFPPLFRGAELPAGSDPVAEAIRLTTLGCEAGEIRWRLDGQALRAAVVFAPDRPLAEAAAALPLCGIGFQNALGALAPPEVAVHLDWEGGIWVNGARCGALAMAADPVDPGEVPGWLVIGLRLDLFLDSDAPGHEPDRTALYEEGCAEVTPVALLEAWIRHSLVWLNRWEDEGLAPVHREFTGLLRGVGEPIEVAGQSGVFLGLDEHLGLLLRRAGGGTDLVPLTDLATETPQTPTPQDDAP